MMVLFVFDIFLKTARGVYIVHIVYTYKNQVQIRFDLFNFAIEYHACRKLIVNLGIQVTNPNFINGFTPNKHGYSKIGEHSAL